MIKYEVAQADGDRDWKGHFTNYEKMWEVRAFDDLRFHRGDQFIVHQVGVAPGPSFRLAEIEHVLKERLNNHQEDTVFKVSSLKDDYSLLFRRHEAFDIIGYKIIQAAAALHGTPYVYGYHDCSWLTMEAYGQQGILLPHKASYQINDLDVVRISKSQILPGDMLFHYSPISHVSIYLDDMGEGRVWDTEPHDTIAPWGGMFGTGVQIRSMNANYYCDWANVTAIGRVIAVNGTP